MEVEPISDELRFLNVDTEQQHLEIFRGLHVLVRYQVARLAFDVLELHVNHQIFLRTLEFEEVFLASINLVVQSVFWAVEKGVQTVHEPIITTAVRDIYIPIFESGTRKDINVVLVNEGNIERAQISLFWRLNPMSVKDADIESSIINQGMLITFHERLVPCDNQSMQIVLSDVDCSLVSEEHLVEVVVGKVEEP
jgi:hypothetical protein